MRAAVTKKRSRVVQVPESVTPLLRTIGQLAQTDQHRHDTTKR